MNVFFVIGTDICDRKVREYGRTEVYEAAVMLRDEARYNGWDKVEIRTRWMPNY